MSGICAAAVCAQDAPPAQQIPPAIVLGQRAEIVRQTIKVWPTVVVVDSSAAYVRMISQWSLDGRFPVLIDDGTDEASQNIARFVRAFEPETVLRWPTRADGADATSLPNDATKRKQAIAQAARFAWGANDGAQLLDVWRRTGFRPPGVVVASADDPAWTAALALAAGHGQPIVWTSSRPASPSGFLSDALLAQLTANIESGLDEGAGEWTWRTLGDDLDAITLCLNVPTKFRVGKEELALTDRIGRHEDGTRWAWCGAVFGNEQWAAYRAMCALYLQPRNVLLFDGYKQGFAPPYVLDPAVKAFTAAGFGVVTNTPPRNAPSDWRLRAEHGVAAGLIFVNSHGMVNTFAAGSGWLRPNDIPMLRTPATVVFIHSFSAQRIGDADTVGGRWLARGAYAYYGSMAEPYLAGFVPNATVGQRLLIGAALGAAVRQDSGPMSRLWKVNLVGDPLITLGRRAPRRATPLTLDGAESLEQTMSSALRAGDLAVGARVLVELGRDSDAVRLAQAALADKAGTKMTAALARTVLPPAFRVGKKDLVADLFEQLEEADRTGPAADWLWHAWRSELSSADPDRRIVALLRRTIRNGSIVEDASALAPALERVDGRHAVRTMYTQLIDTATDTQERRKLTEALGRY